MRNDSVYSVNVSKFDFEVFGKGVLAVRKDSKRVVSLNETSLLILKSFEGGKSIQFAFTEWDSIPYVCKPDKEISSQHFYETVDCLIKEELICEV